MNPRDQSTQDSGRVEISHQRDQIDAAVKEVLEALTRHGYTESSRFAVRLALEEGLANAFRHGHKGLSEHETVLLEWSVGPADLTLTIEDQGPGFDPAAVPDPTLDANLELPSGRGLMLMRAYMTSVTFNPKGNRVTMKYAKPPAKAGKK
jgi:serine/threonine-protein kinase RsbW